VWFVIFSVVLLFAILFSVGVVCYILCGAIICYIALCWCGLLNLFVLLWFDTIS
jgi:hypothetical protein